MERPEVREGLVVERVAVVVDEGLVGVALERAAGLIGLGVGDVGGGLEVGDGLGDARAGRRGDELGRGEGEGLVADDVGVGAGVRAVLRVGARGVPDDDLAGVGRRGGRRRESGDDGGEEKDA